MKCIRCNHDSKHKDRTGKRCPQCKGAFAFEPKAGDPVTDMLFKNAIDAVSAGGRIKWGAENLYYEINRRKSGKRLSTRIAWVALAGGMVFLYLLFGYLFGPKTASFPYVPFGFPFGIPISIALLVLAARTLLRSPYVTMTPAAFRPLLDRWCKVHGTPPSLIKRSTEIEERHRTARAEAKVSGGRSEFGRRGGAGGDVTGVMAPPSQFGKRVGTSPVPAPAHLEPDIADYSFDRAVICDRARTADLLIANNFHFENNCAILSIDGYPESVFETVKAMIKRNPRLHVFTVHDATPDGCRLASHVASAPDWFDNKTLVVDLGLRPRHAKPFVGLLLPATSGTVAPGPGVDQAEATWLSRNTLELAAIRPEDVIKRVYRGLQAHNNDDTSGGGTTNCSSFDSGDSHGGDTADGADSFG